jgi:hypothetical protein
MVKAGHQTRKGREKDGRLFSFQRLRRVSSARAAAVMAKEEGDKSPTCLSSFSPFFPKSIFYTSWSRCYQGEMFKKIYDVM